MTRKPPAHYRRVFFVPSLPIWYSDWYSLFGTGLVGIVPKPGKFGFSSLTLGSVLPGSS